MVQPDQFQADQHYQSSLLNQGYLEVQPDQCLLLLLCLQLNLVDLFFQTTQSIQNHHAIQVNQWFLEYLKVLADLVSPSVLAALPDQVGLEYLGILAYLSLL